MKLLRAFGFAAILFSMTVGVASASTFYAGEQYTLAAADHVDGNLYSAGSDVSLLGNVSADALLVGSKIIINGPVGGDVFSAGSTIDLLSPVNGDVRVLGGTVTIGNTINGDLVVFGGTVHLLAGSVVKGDLLVAGGTVTIDGAIVGNARVTAGVLSLGGPITGNADLKANDSFTFGTTATIGGYLHYSAPEAATIRDGAVAGGVKYTESPVPQKGVGAILALFFGIFFLIKLCGYMIGSAVAVVAFPKCSHTVMTRAVTRFGSALLLGFAVLIATPVLVILLMITLIGIVPALFILFAYLALLVVAKIYAGILVGAFLSNWWKGEIRTNWKWALLGTFILVLIGVLPFFGPIVSFIFLIASLGALTTYGYGWWKNRNNDHMGASHSEHIA
jgi:hypothetical protein